MYSRLIAHFWTLELDIACVGSKNASSFQKYDYLSQTPPAGPEMSQEMLFCHRIAYFGSFWAKNAFRGLKDTSTTIYT